MSTGIVSFLVSGPAHAAGLDTRFSHRTIQESFESNRCQSGSSYSYNIVAKQPDREACMEKLSQYEALRKEQEALRHQFIATELDLALTFVGISKSTDDEERSTRNLNHARKAVEVARKYLGETSLTAAIREELVEKLQKLEPLVAPDHRGSKA